MLQLILIPYLRLMKGAGDMKKLGEMKRKYIQKLTGRLLITAMLVLLQVVVFIVAVSLLGDAFVYFSVMMTLISLCVVVYIINTDQNPAYKLAWTIPILSFPLFGGLLYIISKGQASTRDFVKKEKRIADRVKSLYRFDGELNNKLADTDPDSAAVSKYLTNVGFPLYAGGEQIYLRSGKECLEAMKEAISNAHKYIFIETFILREDSFWEELLELLCEKVREGVEVRLIYDGMGCLANLSRDFPERMKALGIKTMEFNPFRPVLTVLQNNRDHRKIFVVDGEVAITGGINIADEYINRLVRFGHWKDSAIMIKGKAVRSFTLMFLQTWYMQNEIDQSISDYISENATDADNKSFAQPFCDSPLDSENTGESVYLGLISKARDYVYITTPYLIPDNELVTALCFAAKSGVDVRIITPHKPDKWYVHLVTRSFYYELVQSGVKIYEYTPGFIHSKTIVADGKRAVVGSINLDYRSLYLHFENAVFTSGSSAVGEIESDFMKTLEKCEEITEEKLKLIIKRSGLLMSILKVFAPLF